MQVIHAVSTGSPPKLTVPYSRRLLAPGLHSLIDSQQLPTPGLHSLTATPDNKVLSLLHDLRAEINECIDESVSLASSFYLLKAADEWREIGKDDSERLDAIEFFLCSWLESGNLQRMGAIEDSVLAASNLAKKLAEHLREVERC